MVVLVGVVLLPVLPRPPSWRRRRGEHAGVAAPMTTSSGERTAVAEGERTAGGSGVVLAVAGLVGALGD